MRFVTFSPNPSESPRPGVLVGDKVISLPYNSLVELIAGGDQALELARSLANQPLPGGVGFDGKRAVWPRAEITLQAPLPAAPSLRDFYAFEEHVKAARAIRGLPVPDEWYQIPVFYFSNPNAMYGPDATVPIPKASKAMDYELEVACVIGKAGKDIPPEKADKYIFGFTIFNDWSARDLQRQEMRVGLGPAKGKDFASSLGPYITTPDELADYATNRPGVYDLKMRARVNGVERSFGNWKDIHYSFGDMIARASADVTLIPGEVIGSGTVGTGSLLELTQGKGPWLQTGDTVELEIVGLGVLRNMISLAR
jgi:fumarylacetoacetate (FAA) hydrolase